VRASHINRQIGDIMWHQARQNKSATDKQNYPWTINSCQVKEDSNVTYHARNTDRSKK